MRGSTDRLVGLSKFMSLVLRHKPENFGLKLDPFGFVDLSDLLAVLQNRYGNVDLSDIERVMKNCPQSILRVIRAKSPQKAGFRFAQQASPLPHCQ